MQTTDYRAWFCGIDHFARLWTAVLLCAGVGAIRADEPETSPQPESVRVLRNLEFRTVDGSMVKADVFRPADEVVYPLVLMIHGGGWATGDKGNLHNHCQEMAQAGFVAVSINYRLAPRFRYPAQIEDCRQALKWVHQKAPDWQADPKRIAVWGYSAGAQLAGLLVARPQPGEPKLWAAVLGGAPCDFSFVSESSRLLVPVMGATRKEQPEVYRDASPLEFATKDVCPTFFFHGTTDLIVPQSVSQSMYERLRMLDVPCEYHRVEGQGHLVSFFDKQARKLAIDFLTKHLPANH